MKKFMMTLAAVLCCTMMTTVFTACGGDDDDDNNPPKKEEILGIGAHYTFSVTEQMSQLCDYTITYYGNDNKLATEDVTWTVKDGVATWEKTVSSINMPSTFGIRVKVRVKDNTDLEGVKVTNVYPITEKMFVEGITTEGNPVWEKTILFNGNVSTHASTSGDKLRAFLEAMENHGGMVNKCYTFDKEGNEIASGTIE